MCIFQVISLFHVFLLFEKFIGFEFRSRPKVSFISYMSFLGRSEEIFSIILFHTYLYCFTVSMRSLGHSKTILPSGAV